MIKHLNIITFLKIYYLDYIILLVAKRIEFLFMNRGSRFFIKFSVKSHIATAKTLLVNNLQLT